MGILDRKSVLAPEASIQKQDSIVVVYRGFHNDELTADFVEDGLLHRMHVMLRVEAKLNVALPDQQAIYKCFITHARYFA